jgi:iron complex outermembrane recepter protein
MRIRNHFAGLLLIWSRTKYQSSVLAGALLFGGSVGLGAIAQAVAPGGPGVADNSSATSTATADTNTLQEVVVTAEKRSTDLQRTPIAVTALSSATLEQDQVRDLKDIQSLVPNFKMGDAQGIAQITIRGVGSASFLPGSNGDVAVNENEVYVSRPIAQQAGLFDVSNIEVLRGPQGTLFGRNATGGAVDITTALPTDTLSGYGRVTGGNYDEARIEAGFGGPIVDNVLLARFAAFRESHDGYGTNLITGTGIDDKYDYGFRGSVVFMPTSNLQATLIAEIFRENDHSGGFHYFGAAGLSGIPGALGVPPLFMTLGGYAPSNVRDIANDVDPLFQLQTHAVTAIINWNNGPFSIKSISGYRDQTSHFIDNYTGGSAVDFYSDAGEPAHQISEELQLHYDTSNLHLTGGAYFFHENDDPFPNTIVASGVIIRDLGIPYVSTADANLGAQAAQFTTHAYAGFAQGTYDLTQELSLTAGARYSTETNDAIEQNGLVFPFVPFTGQVRLPPANDLPSVTYHATTPKFGIQYQLDPKTMLYASYAQGFKSGGFDLATNPKPYLPEHLTDYELGLKTTMLDDHLRADITGFYYDYTDLQVQQVVDFAIQTANAATAHVYGLEGEFNYLVTSAFEIDASASWTHARYVGFCGPDPAAPKVVTPTNCPTVDGILPANEGDFTGKALANAPDYRATIVFQYTWGLPKGNLVARAEAEYSSKFYFAPDNDPLLSQSAYVKGNLFATYRPDSSWAFTAYARNVGDITTKTSALAATTLVGSPVIGSLAPPRLIGAEAEYKF